MFNNPFLKKDPLVEAVQNAMQDGEMRRQAEAYVNEAFGVYSRKAVIREQLAAYDTALEEAYGALKEGVQIDEISAELRDRYWKKAHKDASRSERKSENERMKALDSKTKKGSDAALDRASKADAHSLKRRRGLALAKRANRMEEELAKKDYDKDGNLESPNKEYQGSRIRAAKMAGKMEEGRMPASVIKHKQKLAGMTDAEKKAKFAGKSEEELKSMARRHGYGKDSNEYSKHTTSQKVDEAAYSAKAARAGKDIGKPGKQFSKIAKSAAKKYGSEERGKKVAGAILARIRAKHMKEQVGAVSIAPKAPIIPKSALAPGQSLRDYMNAQRGLTRRDGSSPSSTPKPSTTASTISTKNSTEYKTAQNASEPDQNKEMGKPAERSTSNFLKSQGIGQKAPEKPDTMPKIDKGPAAPSSSRDYPDLGNVKQTTPSDISKKNSTSYKSAQDSLAESVQIGANRYRIV